MWNKYGTMYLRFVPQNLNPSNPPIGQLRRCLDVVQKIDLAPTQPLDRNLPDLARGGEAVDDFEVPVLDAHVAPKPSEGLEDMRGPIGAMARRRQHVRDQAEFTSR